MLSLGAQIFVDFEHQGYGLVDVEEKDSFEHAKLSYVVLWSILAESVVETAQVYSYCTEMDGG